ncbi:hypothetical protein [Brevundimonas aurifodinae]|uniref:DUF4386 family protein n=2 Tax=Brevundimonas TaxID=41275 RepID=A0ABV1NRW2_9CAUL|nr:MAG: hypothetical protein B7Z42_16040 [Brevundimonas sp. 12-68-7]
MTPTDPHSDRTDAALIAGATLIAMGLMLHHPTGHSGSPDDGRLLADWNNTVVHGAMIGCLVALSVGLDGLRRRLDERALLTRLGAILLGAGFLALCGAAVVNGFASERLVAQTDDAAIRAAGGQTLWALNQSLTSVGSLLVATGALAWSPGLWRLGGLGRVSAGLGSGLAALAIGWSATDGGFGLTAAVTGAAAFALWSLSVAAVMMTGPREEPA